MCSFAQYRPHTEIVSQIEQTFPASPRLSSDFCFYKSPQYASARSGSRFRITAHRNKSCLVLRLSLFALQRVGVFFRDSQCCKCQLYGGLSSTRKSLRLANLSEEWNCYSLQRAPLKNLYFDSLPIFVESEKLWWSTYRSKFQKDNEHSIRPKLDVSFFLSLKRELRFGF